MDPSDERIPNQLNSLQNQNQQWNSLLFLGREGTEEGGASMNGSSVLNPLLGSTSNSTGDREGSESDADADADAITILASNEKKPEENDVAELWCKFTSKYCLGIIAIACTIIIPIGLYSFPQFMRSTDSTMHPIKGSYSEEAMTIYRKSFGPLDGVGLRQSDPMNDDAIILILKQQHHYGGDDDGDDNDNDNDDDDNESENTLIDGSSDIFHAVRNFSLSLGEYVQSHLPIPPELQEICNGHGDSSHNHQYAIIRPSVNITSYYSLMDEKLSTSAKKLCTKDGHTAIIHIGFSVPSCLYTSYTVNAKTKFRKQHGHNVQLHYGEEILQSVRSYVDDSVGIGIGIGIGNGGGSGSHAGILTNVNVTVDITGMLSFRKDISECLSRDVHRMHFYVLPVALILFALALGGHPLLVTIPMMSVLCVVCLWSIVMNILIHNVGLQVTQFTPNVMITLTFGLGIDYSLFLLSRVLSELKFSQSLVVGDPETLVSDQELRYQAIVIMIRNVGHTILTSGITLVSTFLGLLLFPIHSLQSVSIGASVAIVMCIVVNMTLVPAILCTKYGAYVLDLSMSMSSSSPVHGVANESFSFSMREMKKRFRGLSTYVKNKWKKRGSSRQQNNGVVQQTAEGDVPEDSDEYTSFRDVLYEPMDDDSSNFQDRSMDLRSSFYPDPDPNPSMGDSWLSEASLQAEIPGQRRSFNANDVQNSFDVVDTSSRWYRLGVYLAKPKKSAFLLFAIFCSLFYISINMKDLKTSISIEYMVPIKSSSLSSLLELQRRFGKGKLSPYRLIISGEATQTRIDTSGGFDAMQNIVKALEQKSESSTLIQANFTGIAWANRGPISHATFDLARQCAALWWTCPLESLRELAKLYHSSTTTNGTSTLFDCTLSDDPFSDEGVEWLAATRNKLKALRDSGEFQDFEVALEGGASIAYDTATAVHNSLPKMLVTTILAVTILIALFFQSLAIPLRSVMTIISTVTTSYGFLAIAIKRGWLKMGDSNSDISWLTPIMSINMIVGLAIDYDVFLISSILEARMAGFQDDKSIAIGLCSTGSVITAAGCIMGVSFGGLIFSDSRLVQEWAITLTSAVLIDTFIMRTCVVPILIVMMRKHAWWPRKI